MDTKIVEKIIANPAGHGLTRCVLCARAWTYVGLFIPDRHIAARLQGRPKWIIYGLCAGCYGLPDCIQRVENFLFADLAVQ